MGIGDHPTAARSPWQNGHAERLIGSIRRECGETNLRRILAGYRVLQRVPTASALEQGSAGLSAGPTVWPGRREADPRWTSPPILPDMDFGKDKDRETRRERGSRSVGRDRREPSARHPHLGWCAAFVTLALVYAAARKQHREDATAWAKSAPRPRYWTLVGLTDSLNR